MAQQHNTSILHPIFLSSENIVPADWKISSPPLCTPPMSSVSYANGITFVVENEKLQVIQKSPTNFQDSMVPELVRSYIEKLPYVSYKAVGINMLVAIPNEEPESFLKNHFLNIKNCNLDNSQPQTVSFRLTYPAKEGIINLSCDSGKAGLKRAIIINANYHNDLADSDPLNSAKRSISKFKECCEHFENLVLKTLFGSL